MLNWILAADTKFTVSRHDNTIARFAGIVCLLSVVIVMIHWTKYEYHKESTAVQ
jgi:hypothetical protein